MGVEVVFKWLLFAVLLYPVVWSIIDVFRADEVGTLRKFLWIVMLLGLNVLAAMAYLRIGPGAERWDPCRRLFGRPSRN